MTTAPAGLSPFRTFRESWHLLTSRRFGTFWVASLLSSIGTWAQQVAEPWLLLTLGASPFLVGLDAFAMNAPVWVLTLAAGALADRGDRRRIIGWCQSIQMLCPTALIALMVSGAIRPWMVVGLSVVVGVTDALSMPSFQSIVPLIVSREQIAEGLALNALQFNLSRILGPALAGVLMSSVGALACFVVSAASYVPFIGVALWILPRGRTAARDATPRSSLVMGGVVNALRQSHLRGALLTVLAGGVLCAPLVTFSPVLVREAFGGSAGQFSTVVLAFGVGGLLGAAYLLGMAPTIDRRRLSATAAVVHGVVVILAALCPSFWGLPPLLVLAGATMTVSNTAANAVLQTTVDADELGRTAGLYMLAMRGGMSLGALLTGLSVSLLGVRHALLLDGALALGAQAVIAQTWLRRPLPISRQTV